MAHDRDGDNTETTLNTKPLKATRDAADERSPIRH